jgi:hypothetical protein
LVLNYEFGMPDVQLEQEKKVLEARISSGTGSMPGWHPRLQEV